MTDPIRLAYYERPMNQSFLDAIEGNTDLVLDRMRAADGVEAALETLSNTDAYYCRAARDELPEPLHITEDSLRGMPRLLMVSSYGAGYDTIDLAACTARGIVACNQAGGNAEAVTEHALAFILALLKRIPDATRAIAEGTAGDRSALMGREIFGKTVGLIGLGNIGTRMAQVMTVFGCTVLAYDPYVDAGECAARGARKVGLEELLAASDVVSVHCPLTAETRGLIGAAEMATMRRDALLICTARGDIVDEAALLAALDGGHLAGAGLDVFHREPPDADDPLVVHPKVIATSHTAGVTGESRARLGRMGADAFARMARGEVPPRVLNPDAIELFRKRLAQRVG